MTFSSSGVWTFKETVMNSILTKKEALLEIEAILKADIDMTQENWRKSMDWIGGWNTFLSHAWKEWSNVV